jgi:acyl-coenzyme A thioesterase PaaI-like protein
MFKINWTTALLLTWWLRLQRVPAGAVIFSIILRYVVPYSGTLRARVTKLEAGQAELTLKDRRMLRNHLGSIHAMALANFAELTSGLAFLSGQPANSRAIVVGFSIDYLKKARGTLRAKCICNLSLSSEPTNFEVPVEIFDDAGDVVARAKARWRAELL